MWLDSLERVPWFSLPVPSMLECEELTSSDVLMLGKQAQPSLGRWRPSKGEQSHTAACHGMHGDTKTTCGSWFFPSTMWTELKLSGLVASTFINWTIWPTWNNSLLLYGFSNYLLPEALVKPGWCRVLSPKWDTESHLLSALEDHEKRGQKDCTSRSDDRIQGNRVFWTQQDSCICECTGSWQHPQDFFKPKPDKTSGWSGEVEKSPMPGWGSVGSCWETGVSFHEACHAG